jgi:hypothetical protein
MESRLLYQIALLESGLLSLGLDEMIACLGENRLLVI